MKSTIKPFGSRRTGILAVLGLLVLAAWAAPVQWKTATLTEMHRREADVKNGKVLEAEFYTLDAGDRVIVCSHEYAMHPLDVAVGTKLDYTRPLNSRIILRDPKGKEHKLIVEQETMKGTPAP